MKSYIITIINPQNRLVFSVKNNLPNEFPVDIRAARRDFGATLTLELHQNSVDKNSAFFAILGTFLVAYGGMYL